MTLDFVPQLDSPLLSPQVSAALPQTGAACCQLSLSLPGKRLAHLPPASLLSSFVSNFRLCSKLPSLRFCPQRGKVWVSISLFALASVSVLLLATDSFTVSDFESVQSSSRSSIHFSPAVGYALFCLLLAMFLSCLLLATLLSCLLLAMFSVILIFPCYWVSSSLGPRTRVAFFLLLTTGSLAVVPSLIPLTTGSLAVVLNLLPPASLCGSLRLRGSLCHLQHHYSALSHIVIVVSRKMHSFHR